MDIIAGVNNPRPSADFDKGNVEWLEKIFKQTVGNKEEICLEEFKTIVTSKNPFFIERVFQIFDKDDSGAISLSEFLDAMHQFAGKSPNDKIKFLFRVYDIDGDGLIQFYELEHVMRACMEENGLKFSDEQINKLTVALIEDADEGNKETITFEALKKQLEKREGLLENLSTSIDRWLVPPQPKIKQKSVPETLSSFLPYQFTKPYIKNNYVYIAFISIFIFINVALFVTRLYEYRNESAYIMLARACGQCLNFDCSFILVLMLRQCITFLRSHSFNSVVPLDHHIYLHKMTGILIGIFGTVHTLMHLIYRGTVIIKDEKINSKNYTMFEKLLTSQPSQQNSTEKFGLAAGSEYPTGVLLLIILFIMIVCSMPFVRRGGCFQIFHWSHLLYVPFWILMIFHGSNYWKWFIIPGIIYLVEKIRRLVWVRSEQRKTYIISGLIRPSKVIRLVIKRPLNFHFNPGDYVFIKIPEIARYEWHPFTISSAPEQEDYISLHIRVNGEWTKSLYSYFEDGQQKLQCDDILPAKNCDTPEKKPFLSGKKTSFIMFQKALTESRPHTHTPDTFVSDLSNVVPPLRASINNESIHLRNITEVTPTSVQIAAEEGKLSQGLNEAIGGSDNLDVKSTANTSFQPNINYPIGNQLEIFLDGSYGAPSSHIFRAQHAVLIATGIGVTPFASILQSIMYRYWEARHTCPKCSFSWNSKIPHTVMNLRKVDFFWINRDQRSFEWFVNLLSRLEIEQAELGTTMEHFLEMHMYITSALQKSDMKAVGLQLALELLHEKEKRDLVTGLKTRTNAGRPNWNEVFKQLQNKNKGKVTVFFCGKSHELTRTLRRKCDEFGFHFRKESF
ncbi:NADPH oxidase 5 isoform X1 [Solenopsis invicta]|uniref:NADPH oxidase 5 isoform X1 n=1 Tax=Solenopsis invicta TaxID=13686 RepID=UPI000595D74B|nr:NADPH oxidase 5 isoform X1 [Solenopsis invicta]XP_039306603.1 NADPH oxidase 5 isoform X1 [Solenopsis invicta]XP_039306604.1 NADPH oxidase 5 isoform X1 [Solenopsis invicta]XP_039306605.1 NADPH oxidase 5 isoform X1 [Solenopsis invicta]XP_039306606.1 NADPH oxidase 5 isoform X1 [Solenopsis invicta]XP_039306607.1 NADPH oxidase 5 isoform X1 [Solenopsis invicta]